MFMYLVATRRRRRCLRRNATAISSRSATLCTSSQKSGTATISGNAVKSIKSGRLTASVAQLPYLVGKQAVERITDVLNGKPAEKFQYVETLVLDKAVLDAGTDPMLQYVK